MEESQSQISNLEDAKAKEEPDKVEAEKKIKELKAEITHIEDSWAKSSDETFKNIMDQIRIICKDHEFSKVKLF